jgi:hypothetical protein
MLGEIATPELQVSAAMLGIGKDAGVINRIRRLSYERLRSETRNDCRVINGTRVLFGDNKTTRRVSGLTGIQIFTVPNREGP